MSTKAKQKITETLGYGVLILSSALWAALMVGAAVSLSGCVDDAPTSDDDVGIEETDTETDTGGPVCGNNIVEEGEICDGIALGGADCTTFGQLNGQLKCSETCEFDNSECIDDGFPYPTQIQCFEDPARGSKWCAAEMTQGVWTRVLTLCELEFLIEMEEASVREDRTEESCASIKEISYPHLCIYKEEDPEKMQCFAILGIDNDLFFLPFYDSCEKDLNGLSPLWGDISCNAEWSTVGWKKTGCNEDGCWGQNGSYDWAQIESSCFTGISIDSQFMCK